MYISIQNILYEKKIYSIIQNVCILVCRIQKIFRKFFVPVIAIRNISNAAAAATSKAPSVSNLTITCTGITMAALPN